MLRRSVLALVLAGCGATPNTPSPDAGADAVAADVPAPTPRAAGERAPRTANCDDLDPARCLLPWPSDAFAERDPASATGLRVRVAMGSTINREDLSVLGRADGFSRASPVLTSVPFAVNAMTLGDGARAALRLVVSEPGEAFGTLVPVRMHPVVDDEAEVPGTVLIAFPRTPMRAASEHVAVLMDDVRSPEGRAAQADDRTRVALGLRAPTSADERAWAAWNAPVRSALQAAGIDTAHVVRAWTFTTRSAEQPREALRAIRAAMIRAVDEGRARVSVTRVTPRPSPSVAVIAEGFLEGLPNPMAAGNVLRRGPNGAIAFGDNDFRAPFRVLVPRGEGAWPVVLWGHGTGGDVRDASFDGLISENGSGKVNFEFEGWTGDRVIDTFAAFARVLDGVEQSTAMLARALGGAAAVTHALLGGTDGRGAILADVMSAPTLGAMPNPAAGRRPQRNRVVYTGGSLGGTMGAVIARSDTHVEGAVLNVPGGAWTHFTPFANLFGLLRPTLRRYYGSDADLWVFLAMSQALWDEVDGAAWADARDNRAPALLQQSLGDPILPNLGTEFLAAAMGATQVGAVLVPIAGARAANEVLMGTGITQFRVPSSYTDAVSIHGFAAGSSPAGVAAQQQLADFARSVQMGAPRITIPAGCAMNTPAGSCDFSGR